MNPELAQEYGLDGGYAEPPSGWLFFAGTVLGVAGIMRIFDGIWAFRYDGAVPDGLEGALLGTSLSTYGWLWILVGIILILSSFAVLARSQFARWIGIIAGAVLAITAFWWMPYYPVWALTYVIIGVLVVYGLAAHGGRTVASAPDAPHRAAALCCVLRRRQGIPMALPIVPGIYGIDTLHSQLGFSVRHLGISVIRGMFDRYRGELCVGNDLAGTVVAVEAEMASINSGNRDRDTHMYGPDWFDVAAHPLMGFRSTSIVEAAGRLRDDRRPHHQRHHELRDLQRHLQRLRHVPDGSVDPLRLRGGRFDQQELVRDQLRRAAPQRRGEADPRRPVRAPCSERLTARWWTRLSSSFAVPESSTVTARWTGCGTWSSGAAASSP